MTYHIEPLVGKIVSPVILIFPDGERREYKDGRAVAEEVFYRAYIIQEIQIVKDTIELTLTQPPLPDTTFF